MTTPQDPWQQGEHEQSGPSPRAAGPTDASGGNYQGGNYQGGFQPYPTSGPYSGIGSQAAPPVSPQEAGGPPKPGTVGAAFWLSVVAPLVATVLMATEFFLFNSGVDRGLKGDAAVNAFMIGVMAIVVFGYAVLTALWIIFGFKMRAGRDWARVTLTVFAVFWAVWAVASLFSESVSAVFETPPAGLVAVSWAQPIWGLVAMVLFLVLAFSKPSNWFFVAHRKR